MTEIIDYPDSSSLLLRSGYDILERTVRSSPLEEAPATTDKRPAGELELSFIEDSSQLSEFLKFGAQGAYDSLVFKGSVKSEFVEETQINKYSLLFVLHGRSVTSIDVADQPRLSAQAKALAASGNFIGFRQAFGDHYAS